MVNDVVRLAGLQVSDAIRKQINKQFEREKEEEKKYTCAKCKGKFLESEMKARIYSNGMRRRLCLKCESITERRGNRRNT